MSRSRFSLRPEKVHSPCQIATLKVERSKKTWAAVVRFVDKEGIVGGRPMISYCIRLVMERRGGDSP